MRKRLAESTDVPKDLATICEAVSWVITEERLLHLRDIFRSSVSQYQLVVLTTYDGITINCIHKPITLLHIYIGFFQPDIVFCLLYHISLNFWHLLNSKVVDKSIHVGPFVCA